MLLYLHILSKSIKEKYNFIRYRLQEKYLNHRHYMKKEEGHRSNQKIKKRISKK